MDECSRSLVRLFRVLALTSVFFVRGMAALVSLLACHQSMPLVSLLIVLDESLWNTNVLLLGPTLVSESVI